MLSHGGLRSHVIGFLITDGEIQLLYYDHSITLRTPPYSFLNEPMLFIAMLYAMSQLSAADWGHDPAIQNPPYLSQSGALPRVDSARRVFERTELELDTNTTLVLDKELFHQHSIIGRGTCVIQARIKSTGEEYQEEEEVSDDGLTEGEDTDEEGETEEGLEERASKSAKIEAKRQMILERYPIVVKYSYVPEGRESEVAIVKKLRGLAVEDNPSMLDHLPLILYDRDYPAQDLQRKLKKYFDGLAVPGGDPIYEGRVLRMTVQERLLTVLDLRYKYCRDQSKVAKIFRDVLRCKPSARFLLPPTKFLSSLHMGTREGKHLASGYQHKQPYVS
jgi:hypothetical protein